LAGNQPGACPRPADDRVAVDQGRRDRRPRPRQGVRHDPWGRERPRARPRRYRADGRDDTMPFPVGHEGDASLW